MWKCSAYRERMNRFMEARSKRLNTRFKVVKLKSLSTHANMRWLNTAARLYATIAFVWHSIEVASILATEYWTHTRSQSNDHKTHIKRFIERRVCVYSCEMFSLLSPFILHLLLSDLKTVRSKRNASLRMRLWIDFGLWKVKRAFAAQYRNDRRRCHEI